MSAAEKYELVSIEDYLEGELLSPVRHDYVGGVVHAMAGGSNRHNIISGNIFSTLKQRLRGRRCQSFNSDTKVRIRQPHLTRFYYPDAMVICRPNPETDTFQDEPVVIFEVLSESTRRVDETEKLESYLTIPSLSVCVLVEPDEPALRVFRRIDHGFEREVHTGISSVIPLAEIETELPLAEIYEGLSFGQSAPL